MSEGVITGTKIIYLEIDGNLASPPDHPLTIRGNHLSNTTCPTQAFFRLDTYCSNL